MNLFAMVSVLDERLFSHQCNCLHYGILRSEMRDYLIDNSSIGYLVNSINADTANRQQP